MFTFAPDNPTHMTLLILSVTLFPLLLVLAAVLVFTVFVFASRSLRHVPQRWLTWAEGQQRRVKRWVRRRMEGAFPRGAVSVAEGTDVERGLLGGEREEEEEEDDDDDDDEDGGTEQEEEVVASEGGVMEEAVLVDVGEETAEPVPVDSSSTMPVVEEEEEAAPDTEPVRPSSPDHDATPPATADTEVPSSVAVGGSLALIGHAVRNFLTPRDRVTDYDDSTPFDRFVFPSVPTTSPTKGQLARNQYPQKKGMPQRGVEVQRSREQRGESGSSRVSTKVVSTVSTSSAKSIGVNAPVEALPLLGFAAKSQGKRREEEEGKGKGKKDDDSEDQLQGIEALPGIDILTHESYSPSAEFTFPKLSSLSAAPLRGPTRVSKAAFSEASVREINPEDGAKRKNGGDDVDFDFEVGRASRRKLMRPTQTKQSWHICHDQESPVESLRAPVEHLSKADIFEKCVKEARNDDELVSEDDDEEVPIIMRHTCLRRAVDSKSKPICPRKNMKQNKRIHSGTILASDIIQDRTENHHDTDVSDTAYIDEPIALTSNISSTVDYQGPRLVDAKRDEASPHPMCINPWDVEFNPNPVIFSYLNDMLEPTEVIEKEVSVEADTSLQNQSPQPYIVQEAALRYSETMTDQTTFNYVRVEEGSSPSTTSMMSYVEANSQSTPGTSIASPEDAIESFEELVAGPVSTCSNTEPSTKSEPRSTQLRCADCHKEFTTEQDFTKHRRYRKCRRFACTYPSCQAKFCLKADLKRHERTVHNTMPKHTEGFVCRKPGCSHPGKVFPRKDNFMRHIRRCGDESIR